MFRLRCDTRAIIPNAQPLRGNITSQACNFALVIRRMKQQKHEQLQVLLVAAGTGCTQHEHASMCFFPPHASICLLPACSSPRPASCTASRHKTPTVARELFVHPMEGRKVEVYLIRVVLVHCKGALITFSFSVLGVWGLGLGCQVWGLVFRMSGFRGLVHGW